MSFTKSEETKLENSETKSETNNLLTKFAPFIPLFLEQFTGQKMAMTGTIGDILNSLVEIKNELVVLKQTFANFERNCSEQFIHQEQQLSSLQKISRLVSTSTKAIEFANHSQMKENDV